MTPAEVTQLIKDQGIKLIDFKFADLLGTWQHFTTTLTEYSEDLFTDGLGFDGSSIRGWRVINASDMVKRFNAMEATVHDVPPTKCKEDCINGAYAKKKPAP